MITCVAKHSTHGIPLCCVAQWQGLGLPTSFLGISITRDTSDDGCKDLGVGFRTQTQTVTPAHLWAICQQCRNVAWVLLVPAQPQQRSIAGTLEDDGTVVFVAAWVNTNTPCTHVERSFKQHL
jgi:hypothetical protein